jgi:hypothetical protein
MKNGKHMMPDGKMMSDKEMNKIHKSMRDSVMPKKPMKKMDKKGY